MSDTRRAATVAAIIAAELSRQASVLAPSDTDDLAPSRIHSMRIATRRSRSALQTFEDELPEESRRLAQELKWLAGVLGAVRDLDVYEERYRRRHADLPETDAATLARYEAHVREAHANAHAALAAALSSERFRALVADLDAIRPALPDTVGAPDAAEAREVGLDYAASVGKWVIRHGRRIDDDSHPAQLHDLRKKLKRHRYLLESIEPYTDAVLPIRKAAGRLQTVLGEHQDACVAETRVLEYVDTLSRDSASPSECFALGRLAEAERRAAAKARRRFRDAWEDFEEAAAAFFRRPRG